MPHPRDLLNALALITRLPLPRPPIADRQFAKAALFFPLIGLAAGALLAWTWRSLAVGPPPWTTALALTLLWEGIGVPTGRGRAAFNVALLVTALLAKAYLLSASGALTGMALLFAPVLGRWSLVVLAVGARSATRSGQKFSPAVTFREFGIASLLALGLVFTLAELLGLLLIVVCAAATLLLRLAFHRWQGGITWPTVVAGLHVVEIAALSVTALVG
ncbi:MAG TPA: adenosylcobinamide-GDP ribazoletransferase [Terriglobales bacterium]|nr:adenosylcobinamide-GDP ribazoletransferase [Terriglobales bacterium]